MATEEYKRMLAGMREELEGLLEQQEETEQRIAQLKQAIMSFAPLAKEPEAVGLLASAFLAQGMTESIRDILRAVYPQQLSPVEIREQLKNRGQDLSQHKNVMASIHSTLKRMFDGMEITTKDEGVTYQWIRRFPRLHHRFKRRKKSHTSIPGIVET
jgi:chromosome segregation ATPase